LNICLVTRELYPFQRAGIGVYFYNLTKCLSQNNHKVYIITSEENVNENITLGSYKEPNVMLLSVDVQKTSLLLKDFNFAYSFGVYKSLQSLTTDTQIDLVEFADYFGEAFFSVLYKNTKGEFSNTPFVLKLHTPSFECNVANQIKQPESIMTLQEDFAISHIDYVYAVSNNMKDTISKRLQRSDIQVLYNMIDIPIVKENEDNHLSEKKYVLYVGRFEERKGIDLFVKMAVKFLERNPGNLYFVIVGQNVINPRTGEMVQEELFKLIPNEYREYFIWEKPMSREKLVNYYKNAYVSVFPSRFEAFGYVCVEAMNMGSPVIVSSQTAMAEIIDDGKYGILFENGDCNDLYRKLNDLVSDELRRARLSEISTNRADFFSLSNMYPRQIGYYKNIKDQYRYAKKKNDVRNTIIIENIERIQSYYQENLRLTDEWSKLANTNQQLIEFNAKVETEIYRITDEWNKLANTNQQLIELNTKLDTEIYRITDEWSKLVEKNLQILELNLRLDFENKRLSNEWAELAKINQAATEQHTKLDEENKRIIGEWQQLIDKNNILIQENKKIAEEKLNLENENKRLWTEWEVIVSQMKIYQNKELELQRVIEERKKQLEDAQNVISQIKLQLDELNRDMQSRWFLIKQFFKGKKEKKS
jgi:glycosyltransferase involved in cell wall biosynthesis